MCDLKSQASKSSDACPKVWLIMCYIGKITQKGFCCFVFGEVPNSSERAPSCDSANPISVSLEASQSAILTTTRQNHLSCASKENEVEKSEDLSKTIEMILWESQMFHKGSRKRQNKRHWFSTARCLTSIREQGRGAEMGNFVLVIFYHLTTFWNPTIFVNIFIFLNIC